MILSREERPGMLHGRVNEQVLRREFDERWGTGVGGGNEELRPHIRFMSVGTREAMFCMDGLLQGLGYPMPKHSLLYH